MTTPRMYNELCCLSIEELRKVPCGCVICHVCRGQGKIGVPDPLNIPFDDFISCDECDGEGISEQCDRCQLLYEYEQDREDYA